MSNRRYNRGPHPADSALFSGGHLSVLAQATDHLSWLLSHGYAPPSSLKLVGDRFNLVARQRAAVMRSACSDDSLASRNSRAIRPVGLGGIDLEIDTFNLLITLEAALAGGVILVGRDGVFRDLASIHGSYRSVHQTECAIALSAQFLSQHGIGQVLWRIDRPVSNSGRLRARLLQYASDHKLAWQVRLDDDPDRVLGAEYETVVSADAQVLNRVTRWANLARWIIEKEIVDAWLVPMTQCGDV